MDFALGQSPFVGGKPISVRNVLQFPLLHHLIHHRGQLMMRIRMADGVPSKVYGPNREDDGAAGEGEIAVDERRLATMFSKTRSTPPASSA